MLDGRKKVSITYVGIRLLDSSQKKIKERGRVIKGCLWFFVLTTSIFLPQKGGLPPSFPLWLDPWDSERNVAITERDDTCIPMTTPTFQ